MQIIRSLKHLPDAARRGAVAIGNFDGVHLGHARIVEGLTAMAREVCGPAVIFTFDPHPVRILRPDQCPPPLTWTERKAELLARLGVDWVVAYRTDRDLLALSPDNFFTQIVGEQLEAQAMVEGANFYFGCDRTGTVDRLRVLTENAGMKLNVIEPVAIDGETVSSSRIRQLISEGDARTACRMLTEPYRIRGMVTHGEGRGTKIGFPTANLSGIDTLLPKNGVYAGRGWLGDKHVPAAINLGPNPTFDQSLPKVEVHLIGHEGTLYGQPLEVDFLARLREIHRFDSVDALRAQLAEDVTKSVAIVEQWQS